MNWINGRGLLKTIDWKLVIYYLILIVIGWVNIYASIHSSEPSSIFDPAYRSGKQFIWMGISIAGAALILFVLNPRIYESLSLPVYLATIVLLIAVIFLGVEVKGSRSWFAFGPVSFQPAEISKIATSLMLAAVMSQSGFKLANPRNFFTVASIILVPMMIIVAQSETGSALVYIGFVFMLYREGLSGWLLFMIGMAIALFIITLTCSSYISILVLAAVTTLCNALYSDRLRQWLRIYLPAILVLGALPFLYDRLAEKISDPEAFLLKIKPVYVICALAAGLIPYFAIRAFRTGSSFKWLSIASFIAGTLFTFSVDFLFHDVLQDHQRKRIEVLLGLKDDPSGVGYNVNQSMIAIGSGGLAGKGFLKGTQTTYGFVPEQSTDFIFCTIGEEWGFIGAAITIILFIMLIWRIIKDAEHSREAFTRIYGYCVAGCIFMHLFINIGMTIGIMPVIGIPLPFISYGGSSLLTFTVMLFIFIALVRNERKYF